MKPGSIKKEDVIRRNWRDPDISCDRLSGSQAGVPCSLRDWRRAWERG
jgi:hypothetical protein